MPDASSDGAVAEAVVFFHAHPDDEAIFTGGTMRLLADAGVPVVVIFATAGEAGVTAPNGADLGHERRNEAMRATSLLGARETRFLGYGDSGVAAEVGHGFANVDVPTASARLADELASLAWGVAALVVYDEDGTYGHPDHIQVHRVGVHAAEAMGIDSVYECTVDREYLHFVETHLVVEAGLGARPEHLGLAATSLGRPTVLIDLAIDVSSVLDTKQAAMEAHASQLPSHAPVFALGRENFAAVYGQEWYVRRGTAGPLTQLAVSR